MAIDPELNAFLAVFHQDIPDVDQNALNACEQEFIHLAKRVDREVAELVAARDYLVRGGHFSGESAAAFDRNVSELSVMRGQILDCLNRHRILDQYTASDQQAAEGGLWLEYASPIAVAVLAGAVALLVSRVPAWRAPLRAALKSLSQRVVKLCEDRRGAFSLRTAMMLGQVGVSVGQEFLAQTWGPVDNDDAAIDTPGLVGVTGEALVAALLTPAGASVAAAKVGPGAIRKVAAGVIGGLVAAGIGGAAGGYGAAVAESVYDKFSFQETDLVYGENSWREIFTKIAPQAAWDGALEEMFLGGFGGGVEGGLQHMQAGNAGSPTHAPSLPRELPQAIQANPEKALTTLENSIRQENPQWITNERVVERMTEALRPWVPHSLDSQQTHFLPAAVQADPQVALRQLVHVMVERSAMAEVGAGPEPIRAASDAPPVVASAGGEEGRGLGARPAPVHFSGDTVSGAPRPAGGISREPGSVWDWGDRSKLPNSAGNAFGTFAQRVDSDLAPGLHAQDAIGVTDGSKGGELARPAAQTLSYNKFFDAWLAAEGKVKTFRYEFDSAADVDLRYAKTNWIFQKEGKPFSVVTFLRLCVDPQWNDQRHDGSPITLYTILQESEIGRYILQCSTLGTNEFLASMVTLKKTLKSSPRASVDIIRRLRGQDSQACAMDSRSGPAESSESKKSRNGSLGCAELDAAELAAKNLKASEQAREKLSSAFADSPSELLLQRRWPRRSRTDGKKHPITVREVILDCVGVLGSDPDASLYSILEKLCKANRLARRIRNILLDRSIKPVEALTEFARIREALDVCKGIDVGDVSSTGYPKALSLLGEVLWSIEDYRTKKEFIVRVREGELVAHAVSALEKGKSRAYCEPTVAAFLGLAYGEYVRRELGGSNGWKLNVSELKQYRDVFGDLGAIMSWLPSHFDSKNAVGQISHFGSGFLEHYRVAMREKGSSPEKEANAERALVNLSIFVGDGRIVQAKQVAERVAKMEGVRGAPIRKPVDDLTARARSGFIHVARAIPGRGSDVKVGLREVLRAGNWSAVDVGVLAMQRDELMSDGANLKPEEIVSILRKSDAELRDRYPHADTIQQRAQCAFQEEDY